MNALRRIVIGLFLVFGIQGSSVAQAQVAIGPTFDLRFENYSLWSRLGTTSYQGSLIPDYVSHMLILTAPQQDDSAAAAFSPYETTINLNEPFTVSFYFFMAPGQVLSGDGMTFIMTSSAPALGFGGSDLGYGGSGLDGYAFGIDTFAFGDETQAPSLEILEGGSATPIASVATGLPSLMDPSFFTWVGTVSYEPSGNEDETGTLTGRLDQAEGELVFTVSAPVDWSNTGQAVFDPETEQYVGRNLRFGFSAATGLSDDGHFVLGLEPLPEPALAAMLFAGTTFLGSVARRRSRA